MDVLLRVSSFVHIAYTMVLKACCVVVTNLVTISWEIWRKGDIWLSFQIILMGSFHSFASGFDMMKTGSDSKSVWKTIEGSLR